VRVFVFVNVLYVIIEINFRGRDFKGKFTLCHFVYQINYTDLNVSFM